MATYAVSYHLTLTDANGNTAQMVVPAGDLTDTATVANLVTNITGLLTALGAPGTITNAKVTSARISILEEKASPSGAVDAEFSGVEDGAQLNFQNSQGARGILRIPAPIPTVFAAAPNENVVDPGGPVSALITWYVAHAGSGINLINVYNGGVKVGRHARRRAQHKVP